MFGGPSLFQFNVRQVQRRDKMAAGFRTSYNDIVKNDIKHIYSTTPSVRSQFPSQYIHDGITILDRIHDMQRRSKLSTMPGRYFQYIPKYDFVLPRAPAFEVLSRRQISDAVERLTRATSARNVAPKEQTHKAVSNKAVYSAPAGSRTHVSDTDRHIIQKTVVSKNDFNISVHGFYKENTQLPKIQQQNMAEISSRGLSQNVNSDKTQHKSAAKKPEVNTHTLKKSRRVMFHSPALTAEYETPKDE